MTKKSIEDKEIDKIVNDLVKDSKNYFDKINNNFKKNCVNGTNSLHGRTSSIISAAARSIKPPNIDKCKYEERKIFVIKSIDQDKCFYSNLTNDLINDHLYSIVKNKNWNGFYCSDPLNQVPCNIKFNEKKGNKLPEDFLKQMLNENFITKKEYDEKIEYLNSINNESNPFYILRPTKKILEEKQNDINELSLMLTEFNLKLNIN